MIITRISGGLGNQMFQYAMGRALSLRNNTELYLNISVYENNTLTTQRRFLLDKFTAPIKIATKEEYKALNLPEMSSSSPWAKLRRKLLRLKESNRQICQRRFITEPSFDFHMELLKADNCFLSGVWQSEKYFKDQEEQIRKDFNLNESLSPSAKNWLEKINSSLASVSLHVRRGDYVTDPKTLSKIGLCSPEYYKQAVEYINKKVDNLTFFIFSDDIDFVRNHMNLPKNSLFVSSEDIKDYEELMLMKACDHNIIANSSFSWWGAWLGSNPKKIVISPKEWFASGIKTQDLIPENWVRI